MEEIEEALERLKRERFLNERRYAERLAEQLALEGYTSKGIAQALMAKEIEGELCWEVAAGIGTPDTLEDLREIAPELGEQPSRIIRQAQKRGFSEEVIQEWAREVVDRTSGH